MTKKYNNDNRRLEREARMEPPIHIESTSGWLPSRGGCDILYPPKFAMASWPIVPSTAAELPRCTATESLNLPLLRISHPSCFLNKILLQALLATHPPFHYLHKICSEIVISIPQ